MKEIIFISDLPFNWMVQRPQHLAKQFLKHGYKVYYFNRWAEEIQGPAREVENNLFLFSNMNSISSLLEEIPIVWVCNPKYVFEVGRFYPKIIVYDMLDVSSDELKDWKPYVAIMRQKADLIFCTSKRLYEENIIYHKKVYLCPNGTDFEHFNKSMKLQIERPWDLPKNNKKLVGYIGAIASWLDWELIDYLSNRNRDLNFVFVGPILRRFKPLVLRSNVYYLGYKKYDDLPNYLKFFDVCIIPFKINEITLGCNPVKMYEYLSAGKPVISVDIPEVDPSIVYIAKNYEEFNMLLRKCISKKGNNEVEISRRVEYARRNSWDKRGEFVIGKIEEILKEEESKR